MKLLFDARVLTHKTYTGIENYTKYILKYLSSEVELKKAYPSTESKYLAHLWSHFLLPFIDGDFLFCPANIAPVFVPKNKKLVITLHDLAFLTYPKTVSKFFYIYYAFLIPFNIRRADAIITISKASKEEILRQFPNAKHKIDVIPLGIDSKYQILDNVVKKKQLLYVGSINERKNLIGVIEAFEKLPVEFGFNLVIVGNFSNLFSLSQKIQKVINRAKTNKHIIFKQGLDDEALIYEYNVSTVFIFPSFYEGFGLPPLEAMACGTAVITSNISSMPEVCADAATYVDPYNIADMTNKMKILIEDKTLRKQMVKKGLERVKDFTWEKSAQAHLKVFNKVLKS